MTPPLAPDGAFLRRLAVLGATHGPGWLLRGAPAVLGPLFWALRREHRRGVRRNLRAILGPRSPLLERRDELATFTLFARSMAEGIACLGPRRAQASIDVRGAEHFLSLQRRGCVLVTAHTSGFELAGALLAERLEVEVVVVMQPEADARARQISDEVRRRGGLRVFLAGEGTGALELAGALRRGACVAIQVDRTPPGARSLPVTLWGRPSRLPLGPFALARATGAPLLPVFTRRTGFLAVQAQLSPALTLERRAGEEALLDAAQQVADRLGAWIAQEPTGWFDWGQGREDEGLLGCSSGRGAMLEGTAMRLVTFRRGAELRPGALVGDRILDLCAAFAHGEREAGRDASEGAVRARYGASVLEFIERAETARPAAEELLARADRLPEGLFAPLAEAELAAPIPRPTSMRDGYAFRQHVESARRNRGLPMIPEFDLFPVFYFTNHQAVVGPGPLPVGPLQRDRLDFELEAAIVVGRQGRNLRASEADAHVFGYMIMNDWSARAVQMEEMKLSLGPAKGKDFATGLGPVLVTRDELEDRRIPGPRGDRYDLAMTASVNGRQLSSGNLRDMHWTFAELLERISDGVTVFPGDVIGSGTVGTGCLLELNGSKITDNQWLQPGDQVSLAIERLGVLENTIVSAG